MLHAVTVIVRLALAVFVAVIVVDVAVRVPVFDAVGVRMHVRMRVVLRHQVLFCRNVGKTPGNRSRHRKEHF
jgi:hypothetical protein